MQILALNKPTPTATLEQLMAMVNQEAARGWELYKTGLYRQMYNRADTPGVILMLEAEDIATAQAALNTLPMVEAGLIEFDLIPLKPFEVFNVLLPR